MMNHAIAVAGALSRRAWTAVQAIPVLPLVVGVVLLSAGVASAGFSGTYRDDFGNSGNTALPATGAMAWAGSVGTQAWGAQPWNVTKAAGGGSWGSGSKVEHCRLELVTNSSSTSNGTTFWRKVNLTGATQAELSFYVYTMDAGASGTIALDATNDGTNWFNMGTVTSTGLKVYDIDAAVGSLGANCAIRFRQVSNAGKKIKISSLEVRYGPGDWISYSDSFGSYPAVDIRGGGVWAGSVGTQPWIPAWKIEGGSGGKWTAAKVADGSLDLTTEKDANADNVTLRRDVDMSGATQAELVLFLWKIDLTSTESIAVEASSTGASWVTLATFTTGTTTGMKVYDLDAAITLTATSAIRFRQVMANNDGKVIALSSVEVRTNAGAGPVNVLPTVTTQAVSAIGTTTATGNGTVTSLGVPNPTQHGVCWSTSANPTTADSKTSDGAVGAIGAFTSSITGLTPGLTYHVRAYATNAAGTAYGNDVTFKALKLPSVTTQAVSGIGTTAATGNGTITDLGVPNPTAYGVCWNTTGTPTTGDFATNEGSASATGAFTTAMAGLSSGQTYHVRAYATNAAGTVYGNEVTFTTIVENETDYYVDDDGNGNDANDGRSPEEPKQHLQVLLDTYPNIGTGCTVHVAPGTYLENVVIDGNHGGLLIEGAGDGGCGNAALLTHFIGQGGRQNRHVIWIRVGGPDEDHPTTVRGIRVSSPNGLGLNQDPYAPVYGGFTLDPAPVYQDCKGCAAKAPAYGNTLEHVKLQDVTAMNVTGQGTGTGILITGASLYDLVSDVVLDGFTVTDNGGAGILLWNTMTSKLAVGDLLPSAIWHNGGSGLDLRGGGYTKYGQQFDDFAVKNTSFYGNAAYDIELEYVPTNIDATQGCVFVGATTLADVETRIWDMLDDPSLGLVDVGTSDPDISGNRLTWDPLSRQFKLNSQTLTVGEFWYDLGAPSWGQVRILLVARTNAYSAVVTAFDLTGECLGIEGASLVKDNELYAKWQLRSEVLTYLNEMSQLGPDSEQAAYDSRFGVTTRIGRDALPGLWLYTHVLLAPEAMYREYAPYP